MGKAQFAVSPGAYAQVIAELPVIGVVPAAMPGLGIRRHFIPIHERSGRHFSDAIQHAVSRVVVGNAGRVLGEIGVGLDGEVIDRDVRRRECQRLGHVLFHLRQALTGQRVHDVKVEGVE